MDTINPLASSLLQSTQVERYQSDEKRRQIRRTQDLEKNVATHDEELEHQVESAEELPEIHDEDSGHNQPQRQKRQPPGQQADENNPPHLDLTA